MSIHIFPPRKTGLPLTHLISRAWAPHDGARLGRRTCSRARWGPGPLVSLIFRYSWRTRGFWGFLRGVSDIALILLWYCWYWRTIFFANQVLIWYENMDRQQKIFAKLANYWEQHLLPQPTSQPFRNWCLAHPLPVTGLCTDLTPQQDFDMHPC